MSDWLYQYWFFCFKTTKYWGEGPTAWTSELLEFDRFSSRTQRNITETSQELLQDDGEDSNSSHSPTDLCRWYVHIRDWKGLRKIKRGDWPRWSKNQRQPELPTRLRNALEHNDFSPTRAADLPVAIPVIAKAAERAPNELLLDSLGFSIMSRRRDQVDRIIAKMKRNNISYIRLYPLHMAAAYLDGYESCCGIFSLLVGDLRGAQLSKAFVNDLGHTVWDSFMISILKSHSSAKPFIVDQTWKDAGRFPGEEVDVCGRWDADSPALRYLLASGISSTPFAWKHKFCHTSIQATCHCIIAMHKLTANSIVYEAPSGLYIRWCLHCGVKLQLDTLHSLVMTAYHLANNSCQYEDLFGVLACLLCFIACNEDPKKVSSVSVVALMETDTLEGECEHEELTAAGLAEKISLYPSVCTWNTTVQSGWAVFCGVLRLCEDAHAQAHTTMDIDPRYDRFYTPDNDSESKVEDVEDDIDILLRFDKVYGSRNRNRSIYYCPSHFKIVPGSFRARPDLASLWATIQAEILIHRRLNESMSWISAKFSMAILRDQIAKKLPLSVAYLDEALIKPHCPCGRFEGEPLAILSDVIDPYIDADPNPDTKLIKVNCKGTTTRALYGTFLPLLYTT
jgi:hypothetical protein